MISFYQFLDSNIIIGYQYFIILIFFGIFFLKIDVKKAFWRKKSFWRKKGFWRKIGFLA